MTLYAPPKPAAFPPDAFFDDPTIDYPDGDGEPMAETAYHMSCIFYGVGALTRFYKNNPDVLVAGNNFIYYEPNQPTVRVSPDLYVVFGVPKAKHRTSFYTWREGKTPSIVFEFTSKSTRNEDLVHKKNLYEQVLRVPEYILFDPTGDYLNPSLQGFRLVNGVYVPLVPTAPGRLFSQVLGLEIVARGKEIRFFDPARGAFIDDWDTVTDRAEAETTRANQEAARAEAEAQRAEAETVRANEEAQRAEAEAQGAKAEAARREEAEAEVARLRALLAQLTQQAQTNGEENVGGEPT